jgi:hypothetical protein
MHKALPAATGEDSRESQRITAGFGASSVSSPLRLEIGGKFFFAGGEKLYVRGVTYSAFRPAENNYQFPDLKRGVELQNGIKLIQSACFRIWSLTIDRIAFCSISATTCPPFS